MKNKRNNVKRRKMIIRIIKKGAEPPAGVTIYRVPLENDIQRFFREQD